MVAVVTPRPDIAALPEIAQVSDFLAVEPSKLFLFILANVAIVAGYAFAAIFVAPRFRHLDMRTKVGGIGFFALCALTHVHIATTGTDHGSMSGSWFWVLEHLAQAVAVWVFLLGLYWWRGTWGGVETTPAAE